MTIKQRRHTVQIHKKSKTHFSERETERERTTTRQLLSSSHAVGVSQQLALNLGKRRTLVRIHVTTAIAQVDNVLRRVVGGKLGLQH